MLFYCILICFESVIYTSTCVTSVLFSLSFDISINALLSSSSEVSLHKATAPQRSALWAAHLSPGHIGEFINSKFY